MDSRKGPRIHVECPLSFCAEGPAGQVIVQDTGTICDLSWSGCSIQSPTALDKGAYLRMTITLPGQDANVAVDLAKVRWASEQGFGVEFLVLNEREQARLRGFVTFRQDSDQLTLR
jgi:PilZ domain-containing protein